MILTLLGSSEIYCIMEKRYGVTLFNETSVKNKLLLAADYVGFKSLNLVFTVYSFSLHTHTHTHSLTLKTEEK